MSTDNLEQVQAALDQGDIVQARNLLRAIIQSNPSADAWYLASRATTNRTQVIGFLKRALEIDPFHDEAMQALEALQATPPERNAASDSEKEYFSDGVVRITSKRASFPGTTYAMAHITTVSFVSRNPSKGWWYILTIFGGLYAACGVLWILASLPSLRGEDILWLGVSLVAFGLGFDRLRSLKPMYIVRVGSASGKQVVLENPDREYVRQIVSAIKQAIVARQ